MRNSKLKTVIALVFDTWYGTVALWLLLELVMKLIEELLFRAPLPPDSVVSVAQAIHFVQLGLPLVILVSVVVSFVRGKRLRAVGQIGLLFLVILGWFAYVVKSSQSETVIIPIDISAARTYSGSSVGAENKKGQLRRERIDRIRKAAQNLNKPLKFEPKYPE